MNRFITTALIISTMLLVPLSLMQAGENQHSGHHGKHSEAHSHEGMMEQMKAHMHADHHMDNAH